MFLAKRSSRVVRVLLEKQKPWTLSEIAGELEAETKRFARACDMVLALEKEPNLQVERAPGTVFSRL